MGYWRLCPARMSLEQSIRGCPPASVAMKTATHSGSSSSTGRPCSLNTESHWSSRSSLFAIPPRSRQICSAATAQSSAVAVRRRSALGALQKIHPLEPDSLARDKLAKLAAQVEDATCGSSCFLFDGAISSHRPVQMAYS